MRFFRAACVLGLVVAGAPAFSATRLRVMPPDRSVLAVGQRFDIRVEASGDAPRVRVFLDGNELTDAPAEGTFLRRDVRLTTPGEHVLAARAQDGTTVAVHLTAAAWEPAAVPAPPGHRRARNVILFLGDGMGIAHRTAARVVSRGLADGKARRPLAMDTMPVTGLVSTFALNAVVTDSAPGMAAYVTGVKGNNNQEGVFPDDTADVFDNPRVEYLGELLRRTRGPGFNVGIVTTADVTDATPAANAVHTAERGAHAEIAARFLDEREHNAVSVLLGGGLRNFAPKGTAGSVRTDDRDLLKEYQAAGYTRVASATEVKALLAQPKAPARLLGLFSPSHIAVAFDKVGAGRYSAELALPRHEGWRDQPMLDELTRLALRSLSEHSPDGFYLMVEGAAIDKRAHDADAERSIWDTIDFDNALAVALQFARRTNSDADPSNDTLVIVTADHETGGLALVGVGNERYAPARLGKAIRDYAAVFRFESEQVLDLVTNYEVDEAGYPKHPDPSRKLLLGWAAAPDRYENWLSNRQQIRPATDSRVPVAEGGGERRVSVANPQRDGTAEGADNRSVEGQAVPGFLVPGVIENGEASCTPDQGCVADTSSVPHTIAGHTASDVPLSAEGPGAWQFTGSYENTDVMIKILRATTGAYELPR